MTDKLHPAEQISCSLIARAGLHESCEAHGVYTFKCYGADGKLKWEDTINNVVATVGKNVMLDAALAGAAYTVTGPFMGLISGTPTVNAADTMASHAGWTEVGLANAPVYTGSRKTAAWSAAAAGAKALSAALSFVFTSGGTVGGAFLVFFTGAVSTIDNTSGTLFSAGALASGNRAVLNGDTINVSYSISL